MSHISRRKVVKGVAWATPVIAASSVVPAFASSLECIFSATPYMVLTPLNPSRKSEESFVVPDNVQKMHFELTGGSGGGYSANRPGGSGAKVTGIIDVKAGQVIKIVAAGGGIRGSEYGAGFDDIGPSSCPGGTGYGDGGSAPELKIPDMNIAGEVSSHWIYSFGNIPTYSSYTLQGCSGGGSSALLLDGEVIAIAGGGGGASTGVSYSTKPYTEHFPGVVDASLTGSSHPTHPPIRSAAGNAAGLYGNDATDSREYYAYDLETQLVVEGGRGGRGGIGGSGGANPGIPTGIHAGILSFDSQNNQVLHSSSSAGNAGGSGFTGNGGDGVSSWSYQMDDNSSHIRDDLEPLEVLEFPNGTRAEIIYRAIAPIFNGYQIIVSGGGGAGYGGGGSGAVRSLSAITTAQKWNNNPKGIRQSISHVQQAGAGGAGGSYIAPSVMEGDISSADNANTGSWVPSDGSVTVYFCERA